MRYLDPKADLTFKKIFGENPDILMDFLNNILPLPKGSKIVTLNYLSAEQVPDIPALKNSIVDVRCIDNRDRQFVVEMQMLWTNTFMRRVLFNASKAYVRQLDIGQEYHLLQPVYAVSLVNELYDNSGNYYHYYEIVNVENTEKRMEGLSFLFVELPKITQQNLPKEADRALWLRFFTEIKDKTEEVSASLFANPNIGRAIEYLAESAFTPAQLNYYDNFWDGVSRERTLMGDSHRAGAQAAKAELEPLLIAAQQQAEAAQQQAEAAQQQAEAAQQQAEAAQQQIINTAKNLKNIGLSVADIAKAMNKNEVEIMEWLDKT
jgi:predicted transposase/invertase (TIGR01784 family)